jgi:hypothetical protein
MARILFIAAGIPPSVKLRTVVTDQYAIAFSGRVRGLRQGPDDRRAVGGIPQRKGWILALSWRVSVAFRSTPIGNETPYRWR